MVNYSPHETESRFKGELVEVSLYPNSSGRRLKNVTLEEVRDIVTKDGETETATRDLQVMSPGTERDNFKRTKFKAVTFSGIFPDVGRRGDYVSRRTGLIILDIDKLEPDQVREVRKKAGDQPFTLASFISPSGDGVKILVRMMMQAKNVSADDVAEILDEHLTAFNMAADHYEYDLGVSVDPSGKDINRLCYLPHDPEAYFNFEASPLVFNRFMPKICAVLNNLHPDFSEEDGGYETWLRCLMALHDAGSNKRKTRISPNVAHRVANAWSMRGSKYDPGELDKKWESFKERPSGNVTVMFIRSLGKDHEIDVDRLTERIGLSRFEDESPIQPAFSNKVRCALIHDLVNEDGDRVPYDRRDLASQAWTLIQDRVKLLTDQVFHLNDRNLWQGSGLEFRPLEQDLPMEGLCSRCVIELRPIVKRFIEVRDQYQLPQQRCAVIHEGIVKIWEREGDRLVLRSVEPEDNVLAPRGRDFFEVSSPVWKNENSYPVVVQSILKDSWNMSDDMIARFRRWLAVSLVETNTDIPTFIAGPGTGKGTLSRVLKPIYHPITEISAKTDTFTAETIYLAPLSRVNEVEEFRRSNWSDLLRMTDGETIPVRQMYKGWLQADVNSNFMFLGSDVPQEIEWGRGWNRRILNMIPLVDEFDLAQNADIQEDFRRRMTTADAVEEMLQWIASEDFSTPMTHRTEETNKLILDLMIASDNFAAFVHSALRKPIPGEIGMPLATIDQTCGEYMKFQRGLGIRDRRRLKEVIKQFGYNIYTDEDGVDMVKASENPNYPWIT